MKIQDTSFLNLLCHHLSLAFDRLVESLAIRPAVLLEPVPVRCRRPAVRGR